MKNMKYDSPMQYTSELSYKDDGYEIILSFWRGGFWFSKN